VRVSASDRLSLLALALAVLGLAALAGATARPAAATTITSQGTVGQPFTFQALPATLETVTGIDGSQELRVSVGLLGRIDTSSPVYAAVQAKGGRADPRSLQVLGNGDLLFSDRMATMIAETTADGSPVWTYTAADDADLQRPFSAQRITVGGQDLTLIADRWAARVFAVDAQKHVVWQYGTTNQPGLGVDQLEDPFCASYTSAGTVLIADNLGASRVIEVRWSDYSAGAPDNGFTAGSIVWQYGAPGVSGSGPDQLEKPRSPQRLANGDVFMGDADGSRFFVVDRASKQIVWQFGNTDQPGSGLDSLRDPTYGVRLADGSTLIADTGNSRVLRVPAGNGTPTVFDMNVLGRPGSATSTDSAEPRAATFAADGSLWVADSAFAQITRLGHAASAQATSTPLACGRAGKKKAFVRLSWSGDASAAGVGVAVDYSLDSGAWRSCTGIGTRRSYDFPAGTVGRSLAYRVTLTTQDAGATPVLDSLAITTTPPSTGGSGGGGGGTTPGGGNSGGSGTYTYPQTAGGAGGSGVGTGSGTSGTGSGSGTSGSGSGAGGGSSAAAAAGTTLAPPVQSSGSGAVQSVTGTAVQGQEGVSGVPLRAAPGAQLAQPATPGPHVPAVFLAGLGLLVLAAFLVPWPVMAARLRGITGFDHTRPRRYPPFRPLG
jgi:hypothetical protein